MKEEIIIDAENAVLGRLASYVAKQALQGRKIVIVNSEKAIITGNEKDILEKYKIQKARGGYSQKGPLPSSNAQRILKRTIRGMIPYKKGRGKEAYKNIKCYLSVPEEYKGRKMIKSGKGKRGMSLKRVSELLSGGR